MTSNRPSKKHILFIAGVCIVAASAIATVTVAADKKVAPVEKKPATVAPAQQAAAPQLNQIAATLQQKGVTTCAARINQVTNFIGSGGDTGAVLFLSQEGADKRIVSTSLEIVDKDKKSAYASTTFAPNGTGCGASYDAVAYWPKKCEDVAVSQFGGKKPAANLKANIGVLDLGNSTRVFLMPAGDGCVSVKKEVIFQ